MTESEKAKAYDDALKRAKAILKVADNRQESLGYVSTIFPELVESEDEKIRRTLIRICKKALPDIFKTYGYEGDKENIIAWLEKQGEQKKSYDTCNSSMMNNKKSPIGEKRDFGYFEEKSADKVEPKFHEGDWVVTDKNDRVQIKVVNNSYYTIDNGMYFNIPYVDRCWHLWTVQDAIDGDVLSNGDMILIFKEFEEPAYRQHIIAYIGLDSCGHIQVTVEHWELGIDKAKPATKEQCDTLMKAIKDAGYEWDIEKKELKKLTQSVTKISEQDAWSEEDELIVSSIEGALEGYEGMVSEDWGKEKKWLTSIKGRMQPQIKEWSEEDERLLTKLQTYVDMECFDRECNGQDLIDWLKSLKDRAAWKPSEEQMQVFEAVYDWYNNNFAPSETLTSLYNGLKKP